MGVVYLAEDTVLGRRVAIKMLTDNINNHQNYRARFLREARAVSALSHPHIATIHEYGETADGAPYIVMEFIKGQTLAELMLKEQLTIPRTLEIISDVAEGLAEAHSHGIVHRDIKPSNVIIDHRGQVKVLDFGLAKQLAIRPTPSDPEQQTLLATQTREGVIVGTPMYLSPEQALGVEVDPRSDLFSLGAVLYECVAGQPAFFGGGAVEICAKVIRDDPAPPSSINPAVPGEIDQIALKSLAKKPEDRYQTANELLENLRLVSAGVSGRNQTVTRTFPATNGTQRSGTVATLSDIFKRPRLPVGYVAVAIAALALIAGGIWYALRPRPHKPTAESQRLFALGVDALHDGAYHKASRLLQRSVQADPQFALAHARLAEAYTELDYSDQAKDELLSVNDLAHAALGEDDRLYVNAVTATVRRDFPQAITLYEQRLNLTSQDASSYIDLGRAYEKNEQIDKAVQYFVEATVRKPDAAAAFVRLGVLRFRKLDNSGANTSFDQAERLYQEAGNFEGSAEVFLQRGSLRRGRGELKLAREALQKALDIANIADSKSQQVRAKLQLSGLFYSEGNTAEAKQQANEAVQLARANEMENLATEGLLDLGYAFFVGRAYVEAEEYFRQAFEIAERNKGRRNQARANLSLGALYIQQNDADKGMPYVEQAVNFYRAGAYGKEVSQCLFWTARAQLLKADFDGALKSLDEQLQLAKLVDDPAQLARSQEEMASMLGKLELYPQALVRYSESLERFNQLGNRFHSAFCLLNKADMLARLGRHDEAQRSLDELSPLLSSLPSDNKYKTVWTAFAYLIRAQMELSQRRLPEARTLTEKALAAIAHEPPENLGNTEVAIKETLGLVEAYSGSVARGKKLCEQAVAMLTDKNDHEYADSHLALAEVLLLSGDANSAYDFALKAKDGFAARHRNESEWRSLAIAARAAETLAKTNEANDAMTRARQILGDLPARWGNDAFKSYCERKDIQQYRAYTQHTP